MQIELCVASVEALHAAKSLEIDRIELCSNLDQGGLTPSPGFVRSALDLGIETHVLIRPRSGGFIYSESEIELILTEIKEMDKLGVHGIVVGVLSNQLLLNYQVLRQIRDSFSNCITFHRAFDDLVEWQDALEWLQENDYNRVLTSGLSTSIAAGISVLKEMKDLAKGNIEIMAGGGINLSNIHEIIEVAQPDAIHFSATSKQSLDPDSLFSEELLMFDEMKAKKLLAVCRNFR